MDTALIPLIKHIHMTAAGVSLGGFVLRGVWMMRAPHRLRTRWVRTVPHVVDTLLLLSAITLVVLYGNAPLSQPWLWTKLAALIGYIVLGAFALRYAPTLRARAICFAGALLMFAYIVSVAVTRQPWPWL